MDRLAHTLLNLAAGFVIAFVVGSLVRNRRAGMRAGLLGGIAFGVIAWTFHGGSTESGTHEALDRAGETEP